MRHYILLVDLFCIEEQQIGSIGADEKLYLHKNEKGIPYVTLTLNHSQILKAII